MAYFLRGKGKYLMIKISETSFTQRFDDSISSFSSEKRIDLYEVIKRKNVHVNSDRFK